tara:strand:+ start:50 stop:556 length:507 start_codon:yes stop_codon:yes gene_type:complete
MMRKKAKSGTKVKKAQGGIIKTGLKAIKNNKKVLEKMNKKGSKNLPNGKLTEKQKQKISNSFDNQAMERFNAEPNPTQEALDNSYNTSRRKPSLTNKKPNRLTKKKAKSGSTLKKAPAGSKGKGMRSLPKAVRNKIGFAKKGKTVKKAGYGTKAKKAKMGCSTKKRKK